MTEVLLPFDGQWLAMSIEQFREALARGQEITFTSTRHAPELPTERVLDATGMEAATQIPASWFLEQARLGKIPHFRFGKYVRFRLAEVLVAVNPQQNSVARKEKGTKWTREMQLMNGTCRTGQWEKKG